MANTDFNTDPVVFAFWKYDSAPFILGDQGRLLPNGDFKAFGYGGSVFTRKNIIAIYPVELGKELSRRIKTADAVYRQRLKSLQDELTEAIGNLIPEMKK